MKLLALDIETAPNQVYSWGLWNQNITIDRIIHPRYTLCWAAKWIGSDETYWSSLHHTGNRSMYRNIFDLLDEADGVISWYGRKFDIPILNRGFLEEKMGRPSPYRQIDLYDVVRKHFRFESNKLDFVSKQLGLGGKLPHKGMRLWFDCMDGNSKAWDVMRDYNIQDVQLLVDLYPILLPWIDAHPNVVLVDQKEEMACPKCGSTHLQKRGLAHTLTQTYQRYRCMDCGSWLRERFTQVPADMRRNVLAEAK